MPSILSGFEYDIFISYRHNDNRSGWVTEFVKSLQEELASTIKDPVSVYFDSNPRDGLLETHSVNKSLEGKLKCLIFIPIISQTYSDTKSFAWQHEFCAFNKLAKGDQFGRDIKLSNGNVTSRILPVKIYDLDAEDKALLENEMGGVLRAIEFIYKEAGVNRPLRSTEENPTKNQNQTFYRNQLNKVAYTIKEIITSLKNPVTQPIQATKNLQPPTRSIRSRKTLIATMSFLLLFSITGFFLYSTLFSSDKEDEVLGKSIAVLPFVNMSNDPNQEYFSDGLSEELLNLLSIIPELKVIGRTSSFSFKGKNEDLRIIGNKLGVAHILEGSVQKEGNKIRVTAQLIRTADGFHLWGEKYDRDLEGIFKLQDEIAGAVVKQLKLKLLTPPSNAASSNIEVHNLILQGNYFYDKLDKESVSKALDFYLQALTIDSLDANTWAKVARVFSRQAWQNYMDRNEAYEKARKAAAKVIALNDKLAIGYWLLGDIKMNHDFDWDGADVEFQKAHRMEPGNADVLNDMGVLSAILGDWEEAIRLFKQALALDPLQLIFYSDLGNRLTYSNHLEEAIVQFNKILELNPHFQRAHLYLGRIYLLQGKPEIALAEMQQENMEIFKRFGLALAYHALGRKKEADEELTNFITIYQNDWAFLIAEIYAFRGAKDEAFEWLEKAYERKDPWLTWLNGDPFLKNLEGDSRHKAFLKKMKLPE